MTATNPAFYEEENEGSLKNRLVRFVSSSWITLALVTVVAAIFSTSISSAQWVPDSAPFTLCVCLGSGFGALLARCASRWRGWAAALYSLMLSLAVSSQAVGVILPLSTLGTGSFWDILQLMNVRILTFFDRAGGWLSAIGSGAKVNDTGLFIFLIGVIAWNASAWLVWSVVRQKRAVNGLLPYGFLLGLNVYLSDQDMGNLLVFIAGAILLMSRTAFTRQSADWEKRGVDTPYELGVEWGTSTFVLTLSILLAALLAPLVGTPKGWNQLREVYLKFQNRTQQTAEQLFTGVTTPRAPQDAPRAETPVLTVIGAPLPNGQETVMYVAISDPPPPPPEPRAPALPAKRHYWRSELFTTYTGQGWQAGAFSSPLQQLAQPLPANPPPGRYALQQTYNLVASHGVNLFAAAEPVASGPGTVFQFTVPDNSGLLRSVQGDGANYQVTSWAADFTVTQMRNAGTDYPAEIAAIYLQLPGELPRRVGDLARRIVGEASSPYDRAERIQNYLRLTYAYKLDVPPPPPGRDAVDYFLFEAPGGFCTYYASAMVVMLRMEGVPARVATGFAMGDYDYAKLAYRVPLSASHAWVEVYFPNLGWVEFEPTAAFSTFLRRDDSGSLAPTLVNPNMITPAETKPGAGLVFLVLLAGLGGLAFFLMTQAARGRFAGGPSQATNRQAAALYRQVRRALALAGLRAPPSITPDEFLARSAALLEKRASLHRALDQVTALYRQAAFSAHPPHPEAVYIARRAWQRALPEWALAAVGNLVRARKG